MAELIQRFARAALLAAVLVVTVAGCGLFDDAARASRAAAGSDDFSRALQLGDNAALVAPSRGQVLRDQVQALSEDPEVREATFGLGWDVMCDVVLQELPRSLDEVVGYVASKAVELGLALNDEATEVVGQAILDELSDETELHEQCMQLQPVG